MRMMTRRGALSSMAGLAALLKVQHAAAAGPGVAASALPPYEATWNSLKEHRNPQWLSDAKFGIYTHWGPPKASDVATWKPDRFDPEAWGEVIQSAGARFAGPVSEHGVQVAMWDSELTDRSITKQGLKRDVMGEVKAALAKRGIRFLASFHAFDRNERRLAAGGKVREVVDKYDPDIVFFDLGLGGSLDARNSGSYIGGKKLNGKRNTYFGEPEMDREEFLAYYFNLAQKRGKEVQVLSKEYDLSPGVGMRDVEDGREPRLAFDEWLADIDIASSESGENGLASPWFYKEGIKYKSAHSLICELVDATSKNGRILLNVGPKPDGTFSDESRSVLKEIGDWLKVNGEAIDGSCPWLLFGEGPTELRSIDLYEFYEQGPHNTWDIIRLMKSGAVQYGHYSQIYVVPYQPQDVRFTVKGDNLYAVCLGWPGFSAAIQSLGSRALLKRGEVKSVRMLGMERDLQFNHTDDALVIQTPRERPCNHAYTFKIARQAAG